MIPHLPYEEGPLCRSQGDMTFDTGGEPVKTRRVQSPGYLFVSLMA